ncbi:rhomboid family intramembrane serine protease [Ideonella sp. 4Y16]|uniref:rhomboid family intramembrane serine protease n=1 Tax=Ideonella alba TaxID=2824118 RepID=UPI001B35C4CE|nr:rhomboid family intramembrane serine protease [Ideonella alba]MBQ0943671.1 rhomboid family intramembrane serine protease [Ideonella alba]
MPPLPPVTKALMLACTAIFCLQFLLGGYALTGWFGLWPLASGHFMPWQVVTYAFLHGDMLHLFFNMLGMYMFGAEIERLWGQRRYLQFIAASVLTAALSQMLITALVGSMGPTIGISGGLYGLLLASAMLFPNRTIMPLFPPIPMKQRTFVLVFGGLELLQGLMGFTGVAHFAHLGGMLGAWLMIRYWRGQPPFSGRRRW